jgi:hypothetical protein
MTRDTYQILDKGLAGDVREHVVQLVDDMDRRGRPLVVSPNQRHQPVQEPRALAPVYVPNGRVVARRRDVIGGRLLNRAFIGRCRKRKAQQVLLLGPA